MVINKTSKYNRTYKKLINKLSPKDLTRITNIENLIIASPNLASLLNSPYKTIYHIEQKKGNLREYFTARINTKYRLLLKPLSSYPYNNIEITAIIFIDIDTHHYGEG